jgi:hypothetical protein
MAPIGEILIAEGHLTPEGLQEALDWQVLYGGRLGTNLLELQLTKEEHLARALGKQLGAEVAWGEMLVDQALLGFLPGHIADKRGLVPWKLDKRRLKVLCAEINVQHLDELSYKSGRTCVPVVAPEFRIFQLLRMYYGAVRQMRALDFGVVPQEGRAERRKAKEAGPAAPPAPELIDEGAFNEIYTQMMAGRARSGNIVKPSEKPRAVQVVQSVAPQRKEEVTEDVLAPLPELIEPLPEDAILGELPEDAILGEASPEPAAASASEPKPEPPLELPPAAASWEEAPAPPPRDESPLDFSQALRALSGVSDRDSIAHIVLRASRSKAARALLLQVQGGVALGWDGLGEGMENGAARSVALPLTADSAFGLVVRTRSHYLGPLQKTAPNIRFLAALGKKVPKSSAIFPILHRGRVSHMLYLDNGHKEQAPTDVGEMLILSQRISQTVEALVARTRKPAR